MAVTHTESAAPTAEAGSEHQPASPRRRWPWAVAAVAATLVVAVAVASWPAAREDLPLTVELDGRAPAFDLENVRAGAPRVTLAAAAGRPVVVNLWASWCPPCREEMPALANAANEYAGRVEFLGVNHQDTRDLALELLDETGIPYPSGFDPAGSVALDYGLYGMPTTIFISADGEMLERRTGAMTLVDFERAIDRLFFAPAPR